MKLTLLLLTPIPYLLVELMQRFTDNEEDLFLAWMFGVSVQVFLMVILLWRGAI